RPASGARVVQSLGAAQAEASFVRRDPPATIGRRLPVGEERSVSTTPLKVIRAVCPHDCPDTCGMVVTVDADGRAVDLRGDREHPFTHGFLCQKVAHYLERTYHPERLKWPMRRVGPKGSGRFMRIGWDEAIATITDRFRAIAASPDGSQAILPYSYAGTM